MYKTIAIDGACRRNGQPDCVSAGACFIHNADETSWSCECHAASEEASTSQRGELTGMLLAVEHVNHFPTETVVITDSEYLFNSMTKCWVDRWMHNNWLTAQGDAVKNQDLWKAIWSFYVPIADNITFYHVKGHLLSIGVKKYHELVHKDSTGAELYKWALNNKHIQPDKLQHAKELSKANNGFVPEDDLIQQFAAMNLVADVVANLCIETVEAEQWRQVLRNVSPTATVVL